MKTLIAFLVGLVVALVLLGGTSFSLNAPLAGGECFAATGLEIASGNHNTANALNLVYIELADGRELVIENRALLNAVDARESRRVFTVCTGPKITKANNKYFPEIEIYDEAKANLWYGTAR